MRLKNSESGSRFPLTRRGFLEQFGLVGGSALVMSAMRSWDLMAQAGPRPMLSGRANGTKVIVLGAGVSGLTTAYELGKLGYNVSILEARDRVGGVNWTLRKGSTHTEIGPGGETQVCNFDDNMFCWACSGEPIARSRAASVIRYRYRNWLIGWLLS